MEKAADADYFGSFLDAVKESPVPGEPGGREDVPYAVIRLLSDKGPQHVSELQSALGLDMLTFSHTLEAMVDAKLIQVTGVPGHEIVSLTEEGHTLARLQASAT